MNNVFVYCELEGTTVAEVSQELLTKGRKLANTLGVQLEAVAAGAGITGKIEPQILPYGVIAYLRRSGVGSLHVVAAYGRVGEPV